MTDEDRATIYGRAMLALKKCRTDEAALRSYFSEYGRQLDSAGIVVRAFLEEPFATEPMNWAAQAKNDNMRLTRADFEDKVDELLAVIRRMRELEAEVAKF